MGFILIKVGQLLSLFISLYFVPCASSSFAIDVITINEAKKNYHNNINKRVKRWNIDTTSKTRYRREVHSERIQQYFRLRFRYNVENSDWEVIGIVRTGTRFNSSYDNLYNFDNDHDPLSYNPNFNLSHFYLKNSNLKDGKINIELGSIPTDKGIQRVTALDSNGFIEGARVKVKTELGDLIVAGGYLVGEEQPQIFNRENRELNYFEVRLHKDFLDKLGSEKFEVDLGAIHYKQESYFSQVVKARYHAFSSRIITLIQEGLYSNEGMQKAAVGFEFDLLNILAGVRPNKEGIRLGLRYQYMSDDSGELAYLGSGFYSIEGNTLILEAKKRIPLGKGGRTSMELGYRGRESLDGDQDFRHEVYISVSHSW